MVPADNQPNPTQASKRRPCFWVGPLVAGSCFALGFGITHRIIALQGQRSAPQEETFSPAPFPGERLENLRSRYGDNTKPLSADVAAQEAEQAKTRLSEPEPTDANEEQQAAKPWAPEQPTPDVVRERPAPIPAPELPAAPRVEAPLVTPPAPEPPPAPAPPPSL